MTMLEELNDIITICGIPVETGVFSGVPPDEYVVITPLTDTFNFFADDKPQSEIQEARLSLFSKGNYIKWKSSVVLTLMDAAFMITDRRYIEHEDDTGYHHYAIDVAKCYEME